MKKIYFVRHGESNFNAGGIIKPENENELTALGHEQAKFVGQRVKNLDAEIIIASTLLRARETAGHIADVTELSVETSPLFIERRYPSGQMGLTLAEPQVKAIIDLLEVRFGDDDANHSDEETFEEIKMRAVEALDYLKNRPEETLVVVTHSIFLRVLLSVALYGASVTRKETGKILNVFKTKNTGLTLFEYDKENNDFPWAVRTWNDHAHLG